MKKTSVKIFGLLAIIGSLVVAQPAAAFEQGHAAFASTGNQASIPVGHADFCNRMPHECQPNMGAVERVSLSQGMWDDLQEINNHYNTAIIPVSDQDLYGVAEFWTYPVNGYGDCEDIALAKRAALIERGWNPSVLLMTIVMQEDGEGHAILMVRTDRGDMILDNQEGLIKTWTDTPYTFLKRQSQAHAGQWVDILDTRDTTVVATAAH